MKHKTDPTAIYEVTIGGQYAGRSEGGITQKNFEVDCIMTEEDVCGNSNPLSAFMNHIHHLVMREKYEDYIGLLKCKVVGSRRIDKDVPLTNIHLFSLEELTTYVDENDLPVEKELYTTDAALRHAIEQATSDDKTVRESFIKTQNLLRKTNGEALAAKSRLRDLNLKKAELLAKAPPKKPKGGQQTPLETQPQSQTQPQSKQLVGASNKSKQKVNLDDDV